MFKIGTLADWFGVGLKEGIRESQRCGATGVQIYAADTLDPRTVTKDYLNEIKATLKECSQEVTALCGELGGFGLEKKEEHKAKLSYLRKTVDLANDLECKVITTHIGAIPSEKTHPRYEVMLGACSEIGEYAASRGVTIAVETGPEAIKILRGFVDDCNKGLGINYDPANLVMVGTDDEVQGVYDGGSAIVHTHAKDGICVKKLSSGEEFYHGFAVGGLEWTRLGEVIREMPLGEGNVRWEEYLKALKDIGYNGYLTIEREITNGAEDIRKAVCFLNEMIEIIN